MVITTLARATRKDKIEEEEPQKLKSVTIVDEERDPVSSQRGGLEFIQAREQLAAQIDPNNVSPLTARRLATAIIAQNMPTGRQISVQSIQKRNKELQAFKNKIGKVGAKGANIKPAGFKDILSETATKAGIAGAGAGGTAAIGGALGLSATAATGVGAIALGAASAVFAGQIVSNLKEERRQQVKVEKRSFADSQTNIKAIITNAKNGGDPLEAIDLYNREIAIIYQNEANLEKLDESKWANAREGLGDIESFRRIQFIYDDMLFQAISQNPDAQFEFPDTIGLDTLGDIEQ